MSPTRFWLGMMQMFGATIGFGLLLTTGISIATLAVTLLGDRLDTPKSASVTAINRIARSDAPGEPACLTSRKSRTHADGDDEHRSDIARRLTRRG
jgi:hypothetical protein